MFPLLSALTSEDIQTSERTLSSSASCEIHFPLFPFFLSFFKIPFHCINVLKYQETKHLPLETFDSKGNKNQNKCKKMNTGKIPFSQMSKHFLIKINLFFLLKSCKNESKALMPQHLALLFFVSYSLCIYLLIFPERRTNFFFKLI